MHFSAKHTNRTRTMMTATMPKEIPSFAVLNRRESIKKPLVLNDKSFRTLSRLMFANGAALNLDGIFLVKALDDHNIHGLLLLCCTNPAVRYSIPC